MVNLYRHTLRTHQWIYENTDGRLGHRLLFGNPTLLLHTVGRKSGLRRTTALTYARDERRLLVVASAGGAPRPPDWLLNLEAWPEAEVQIGRDTHRVHARITVLADPDYARRWLLMDAVNDGRYTAHQQKTARIIPIVELTAVRSRP